MKKAAIIVAIVGLLGLGAFAYLGGFEAIPIESKSLGEFKLYGLTYRGTPQDEGLKKTFEQVESLKEANPEAVMHTIYYVEPAGKLDTMKVFVGLDRLDDQLGKDWEEKTIQAAQALVADLKVNKLVMPRPETVKDELRGFAADNGWELQGLFIDRLLTEDHVQVIAPLRKAD
ncbi:GyrI-like domain-containing protein [Echinicola salinicaeni]|uniref:GyrI-like domain-containing protein n=1 Tax=Echinicola salinicaeni TaxID=2762757 RepID=UPI001646E7A7|nr:GyrI-like domain-containing protein [Echinicola salinicaeni]